MSVDLSDPASGAVNYGESGTSESKDFALAWIRTTERVASSTRLGHIAEPFERPEILQFYLDGIQWVLGDLMTPH